MKADWFKSSTDKDKRKKEVQGFSTAFKELTKLLETKKKSPCYDYTPGWEYKHIAIQEYNKALDEVLGLINIEDKDD